MHTCIHAQQNKKSTHQGLIILHTAPEPESPVCLGFSSSPSAVTALNLLNSWTPKTLSLQRFQVSGSGLGFRGLEPCRNPYNANSPQKPKALPQALEAQTGLASFTVEACLSKVLLAGGGGVGTLNPKPSALIVYQP